MEVAHYTRNTMISLAVLFASIAIGYGLYQWWRPGAPAPKPPLPGHVYPVRHEPGLFVVDNGYGYLKRALCKYLGGDFEPKLEPISSKQWLLTCVTDSESGDAAEPFSYPRSREFVLP